MFIYLFKSLLCTLILLLIYGYFAYKRHISYWINKSSSILESQKNNCKDDFNNNILIVQAHPDDETIFFSPTLLSLKQNLNSKLHILCLSKGRNCGDVRKNELEKAIELFSISKRRLYIDDLEDGEKWTKEQVYSRISSAVDRWKINTILTFDEYGCSGHSNHISCYEGTMEFSKDQSKVVIYKLFSYKLFDKYFWMFSKLECKEDLQKSIDNRNDRIHFFNPSPLTTHEAMLRHFSQYVWYRKLFVIFSRNVYENIMIKI